MALGRWLYPHYLHHALDSPLREYAGWIGKGLRLPARQRLHRQQAQRVAAHRGPLFLFPLQLETDYQIRDHGTGETLAIILKRVLTSFAEHAPAHAMLAIKVHPMDNGWARWDRQVTQAAATLGIADRVAYLDGGSLDALLPRTAGVVTVNSTVGLSAIAVGRPCLALGRAIYALPGLTHCAGLDSFWTRPEAPDAARVAAFLHFLRMNYHIPGTFDGPGARIGAENLARRLAEPPPEYP
ncbi:hypothetical protein FGG78_37785 [Thioclava sp. BHET1]|nr:hypothetical protein FGG78_37785 [Thioclava sp. BHET1]